MNDPERPLPESYWVEPGHLLAGEHPGGSTDFETRKRLTALLTAGFDTFLDLTPPDEYPPYQLILAEEARLLGIEATHLRFPIADFGLPTRPQMTEILDTIDAALAAGHKVYLHCRGGIGRTGTTVGCHLIRRGKSGAEALRQLAEWWHAVPKSACYPHSPETAAQVEFVRAWPERSES
ncbi:MAG: hypothetical protein V2A34_03600 [Lentisphaerota bacterium]